MIKPCNEYNQNKIIVAEENKKKFVIKNNSQLFVNKVQVDGCYIKTGIRCDFLFEIFNNLELSEVYYVELKGTHIEHGIEQLEATINHCKGIHSGIKRNCALVISKYPKASTSSQILKKKFLTKTSVQLKIESKICTQII
ncbi:MAG: hypothetical protein HRT42_08725 [Campylobacteraceae bacterium]|nr:hypothetical protein [Campylobacteraceae bacterium]